MWMFYYNKLFYDDYHERDCDMGFWSKINILQEKHKLLEHFKNGPIYTQEEIIMKLHEDFLFEYFQFYSYLVCACASLGMCECVRVRVCVCSRVFILYVCMQMLLFVLISYF